ncbi:suppressor protein SRP40 [Panicum miliaceum]|uniref:Suppressor protein SRP40 n=1 Tax=Panicum miliaceum TaxID=4540 RepID=A0A3L6SV59_PANMI|nr:suppressor protein SRP40 [Panicum miliaceum]
MLFVPRQVALAAASSSSQPRAAAAMAKEEGKKEKKSKSKSKAAAKEAAAAAPDGRAAVVASVAAFLEAGGFPRTLAALQSEADLEAGAWRSSPVNLEELVAKFLDSSNPTPVAVSVGSDEQDKTINDVVEDGGKKKKEKKTDAEAGESENKASEPSAQEKPSENAGGEAKEKKQKKKKKDDSSAASAGSDEATETVKNDDQKKPDGKKKKSKKHDKADDVETRLDKVELAIKNKFEEAEKLNGDGDKSKEEESKSQNDDAGKNNGAVEKKKKKKKDKSATETSDKTDAGAVPADGDAAKGKSDAVETVKVDNEKKAKKKRKKSDPEENVQVEGKEVAGKDLAPNPEDENKCGMEIEEGDIGNLSNENAVTGKKRKLEEVDGSNPPATAQEDNTANQSLTNGFAEDKTNQDSNIKPSKRQKHTSEPKTVNAFQRVKLEDVKFADERLQDNSYWAKGGAETGYGAKAQEVLGQVRGRGFRQEKTKKKRGTYRGGQIDLQTHSIKFENSDDE